MPTVSTPTGVLEQPVNPIGLALAEGATFVARGFAGDIPHLTELYIQALTHRGFAIVDVFQPCVTWNKVNTFSWFRERVYKLEDEAWDDTDRSAALELSMTTFHELTCSPAECRVPVGVYFRETGVPTYADGSSAAQRPGFVASEAPRDVRELMLRL